MAVWGHIAGCLAKGRACALVTIVDVDGSTPRKAGARMVVRPDGGFFGTIGGGTLEFESIRKATAAAAKAQPGLDLHSVSLGPDLGQCCGGRARIAIEVLTADALESAQLFAEREALGTRFGTVTDLVDGVPAARGLSETAPDRAFAPLRSPDGTLIQLLQRFGEDRQPLVLFGAGHVGKALILALAPLPFTVTWIDSRAEQFPGPVPANVTKCCVETPAKALDRAPDGAFVLAMTHSHALDEDIMAAALLSQRFAYCGVIGSRTKRARFLKRLKTRGLDETLVSSMACPVGRPSIRSKHPAAIAAGIACDLLERSEAAHQQAVAPSGVAQT